MPAHVEVRLAKYDTTLRRACSVLSFSLAIFSNASNHCFRSAADDASRWKIRSESGSVAFWILKGYLYPSSPSVGAVVFNSEQLALALAKRTANARTCDVVLELGGVAVDFHDARRRGVGALLEVEQVAGRPQHEKTLVHGLAHSTWTSGREQPPASGHGACAATHLLSTGCQTSVRHPWPAHCR